MQYNHDDEKEIITECRIGCADAGSQSWGKYWNAHGKPVKSTMKKYYEFVNRQSIYPTTGPVESRSLAIWGIDGMKVPETKTNH